jgi:RNA polymerase sigma-70 factor, ECF subfamily
MTDAELARDVHDDTPRRSQAETELCRRFGPRVRSYGLRHLGEDGANELAQRVLMLVIAKLRAREVRELDCIASFVLGTAHHVTQTIRRANSKMRPLSEWEEPSFEPAPATALDVRHVADCMHELDERARSVIVLSFFEELTTSEIASAIAATEGNVRVMRHRALAALRQCLERNETVS